MAAKRRNLRAGHKPALLNKLAVRVANPAGFTSPVFPGMLPAAMGTMPDMVFIDQMEIRFTWNEAIVGTLIHFTDTLIAGSHFAGHGGTSGLTLRYNTPETSLHRLIWGLVFQSAVTGLKADVRKDGGNWKEVATAAAATERWEGRGDFFQVG